MKKAPAVSRALAINVDNLNSITPESDAFLKKSSSVV